MVRTAASGIALQTRRVGLLQPHCPRRRQLPDHPEHGCYRKTRRSQVRALAMA